jgi:hypothetical protein
MQEDLRRGVRGRVVVVREMDEIAQIAQIGERGADGSDENMTPEEDWSELRAVNRTGKHSKDSRKSLLEGVTVRDSWTSQVQRNQVWD